MAWNPAPEVAAARDFGNKFGAEQVIILHIKGDRVGYASYGKTRQLCAATRPLADAALTAVMEEMKK